MAQIITGTANFESIFQAVRYYAEYNPKAQHDELVRYVKHKIQEGEIAIGEPDLKEGETMYINNEGRYCIVRHMQGSGA